MFGIIKEPDDRSVSENNSEVVNIHWASSESSLLSTSHVLTKVWSRHETKIK